MGKAQVTLFIIIGIVVLVVFLMLFSLSGRMTAEQRQAVAVAKNAIDSSTVNVYVTQCLQNALEKGVVLLASQGGRIYNGQNGSILNCTKDSCTIAGSIDFSGKNVSYGLTLNPAASSTPKYPCLDDTVTWPYCRFYFDPANPTISLFGKETLPLLEEGQYSIKAQLEKFIEADVDKCIDFSRAGIAQNVPFRVEKGAPKVNVDIGTSDVTANLELPLKIYIDSKAVADLKKFTFKGNIRLRYIYNFVSDIIKTDNRLLSYDISTGFSSSRWYMSGMQLSVSYSRKANDDIILVTDNQSRIKDMPLEFAFARQNLPPVLNYIHTNFSTQMYDEIYLEDQKLELKAQGYDPNEDRLTYRFSGWKIDYDEWYDNITMTMKQRKPVSNQAIINNNTLTLQLTRANIGYHNITVYVSDGQYEDYQVVRILVDDKIKVQILGRTPYSEIPLGFASIEDPYLLEAATIDYFNPGETIFSWQDGIEGKLYEGTLTGFWLPGKTKDYNTISINNVGDVFNASATRNITVKATAGIVNGELNQDVKTMVVNVKQCLPHVSNAPPYPFNNNGTVLDNYNATTTDSFMGNHTCCVGSPSGNPGEWKIAQAGTICYEQTEYGAFNNNDVSKKGSVWRCDGKRGNICGSPKEELPLTLVDVCVTSGGPYVLCQGPNNRKLITAAPQSCVNYTGADFDNNACNIVKKCSSQSVYNSGGDLLCQGGCNGKGRCTSTLNCESASAGSTCVYEVSGAAYYKLCSCVQNTAGEDYIACSPVDLDNSQQKCIQCRGQSSWIDAENRCCRDDAGESC